MDKKLNIEQQKIEGVEIITPNYFEDHRGKFSRLYCDEELNEALNGSVIRQINLSLTNKVGAFRGFHFQYPPNCEIKFVRCLKGKVLDFVIDLRQDSKTYLEHISVELSEDNMRMIKIPKGCAHGFQVLESESELLYLHTERYTPGNEGGLNFKDPKLNIQLPLEVSDISERDLNHKFMNEDFKGIKL